MVYLILLQHWTKMAINYKERGMFPFQANRVRMGLNILYISNRVTWISCWKKTSVKLIKDQNNIPQPCQDCGQNISDIKWESWPSFQAQKTIRTCQCPMVGMPGHISRFKSVVICKGEIWNRKTHHWWHKCGIIHNNKITLDKTMMNQPSLKGAQ